MQSLKKKLQIFIFIVYGKKKKQTHLNAWNDKTILKLLFDNCRPSVYVKLILASLVKLMVTLNYFTKRHEKTIFLYYSAIIINIVWKVLNTNSIKFREYNIDALYHVEEDNYGSDDGMIDRNKNRLIYALYHIILLYDRWKRERA